MAIFYKMMFRQILIAALFSGLCVSAMAQPQNAAVNSNSSSEPDWMQVDTAVQKKESSDITHEIDWSYSYVGGSDIHRGDTSYGNLSENHMDFSYVASIPVQENWQLRVGLMYDRYDFGSLKGSVLPNTLGAAALILGADINLSDQWIMRVEIRPGVYSDFKNVTIDQCNLPLIVGATYLVNADLQWFFGLQFDPHFGTGIYHWDDSPVMPGVGARWHFADQWTLMAMLPDPELQYDIQKNLQLYVGARMRGGNYRMSNDFGKDSGHSDLGNANLSYREIRVGLGARYTITPGIMLEVEGGSAVTRQFYYSGPDMQFHTDPAGYGQIQLKAEF
jgi:opacity protein-like surface antigen